MSSTQARLDAFGFSVAISYALVTPFTEEWLFRGVLWQAVRQLVPGWATVAVTAVLFTLYHGPTRVPDYPVLFVYGLALGVLRLRTKSLMPCILVHSVTVLGLFVMTPSLA